MVVFGAVSPESDQSLARCRHLLDLRAAGGAAYRRSREAGAKWPVLGVHIDMTTRRRSPAYGFLAGLCAGALLVGLVVPLVAGDADGPSVAAGAPAAVDGTGGTAGVSGTVTDDAAAVDTPGADLATGTSGGAGTTGAARADTPTAGPGPHGPSGTTTARAARPAGEGPGVTDDAVTVGVFLPDLGAASRLGFSAPGFGAAEQREAFDAYLGELNERGGLGGRRIRPVFRTVDITNADSMRAACVAFAEDDRVLVALSAKAIYGDALLCMTERFGIPLFQSDGVVDEYVARARGLLVSTQYIGKTRGLRNMALELERLGALQGHRIGIVGADIPGDREAVHNGLVPQLRALGRPVTHLTMLPADLSAGASQIPVEVQQMRAKGVDVVLLTTNVVYSSQFANQAESVGFRPTYGASDVASSASDLFLGLVPASFRGIGITALRTGEWRVGIAEPAFDADCARRHTARTGRTLSRESGDTYYSVALDVCTLVRRVADAAAVVGPTLSRRTLAAAVPRLGAFDIGFAAPGSYRPGKLDAVDSVRPLTADMACRCWKPSGPFVKARA